MTPIYQTDGQCFAACVASVFDVSLDDVPNPDPDDEEAFWIVWRKWLSLRNLDVDFWRTSDADSIPPAGYVLVDYYNKESASEDDCHVVVALNREMVHDPKAGPHKDGWPWAQRGFYLFRVLDPSKAKPQEPQCEEKESGRSQSTAESATSHSGTTPMTANTSAENVRRSPSESALQLCYEIEKLPASEQQTRVSMLASELYRSLSVAPEPSTRKKR